MYSQWLYKGLEVASEHRTVLSKTVPLRAVCVRTFSLQETGNAELEFSGKTRVRNA